MVEEFFKSFDIMALMTRISNLEKRMNVVEPVSNNANTLSNQNYSDILSIVNDLRNKQSSINDIIGNLQNQNNAINQILGDLSQKTDILNKQGQDIQTAYSQAVLAINKAQESLDQAQDSLQQSIESNQLAGLAKTQAVDAYNQAQSAFNKAQEVAIASWNQFTTSLTGIKQTADVLKTDLTNIANTLNANLTNIGYQFSEAGREVSALSGLSPVWDPIQYTKDITDALTYLKNAGNGLNSMFGQIQTQFNDIKAKLPNITIP